MPTNPLLSTGGLPLFDQIRPEHVVPAIDQLLADSEAALEAVVAPGFPAEWKALSTRLDCTTERLSRAWSAVSHLNGVADTPELRAAYNDVLPRVTEFWTRLGADERLYAKYKAIDLNTLTPDQRQALKNAIRNFVLGGAELQGAAKERFAAIQERQAELGQKFSENALDATDAFAYYASLEELAGVPDDIVAAARAAAESEGKDGHKLTLKMPSYLPVMQFATSRPLRERMYRAYVTRASDQAGGELVKFDNAANIREILALRQEEAQLLGYKNFAEVSLVPKMADSPAQVVKFLRELAAKARPHAEKDVADMRAFASEQLGIADPQAWDWTFIAEKLKEHRYAFSEQEVKEYFTAPKVLAGLFKIIETLFEVEIRRDEAPVWTDGVEFFRLERAGELVGQFYLDPAARTGKRGGAWMDEVRSRWVRPDTGSLQTPVAHLVCNFAEGVEGKPPLLTHDDVITLFHESGHGLHHMLTRVDERDVAGISGVEWDAVELPSQFMENFCWEWNVLRHMTSHVDTGQPLPRPLFDKMLAAKNFQSGLATLRQVEYALYDMVLHMQPDGDFMDLLRRVREEVAVLPAPAFSRTANTFSHIFAGGYAAGYYSYKWAEVLSADAWSAFEETMGSDGSPSVETGRQYRRAILEAGGSRPAMESFKAFRGREPSIDALLRHQGMA
ncbi:M3 family metallopeptidase [Ramlibacter algicola]|uniref:oligopeptidase A n=1 Tax=Ramlibacter algicola TaxID=2795217 RepID=A0A934Q1S6_9BURK|nr:M3 family metallopeptidase [Ramlibacter algicola]MBK0393198.1 M3 family metallopeptidase [Ramlibacter algicola]